MHISRRIGDLRNSLPAEGSTGGLEGNMKKADRPSAISLAFWVHILSFFASLMFFWLAMIPSIGKVCALNG